MLLGGGGQGMQNQAIQDQLIGFFTDGLSQDFMKMKVMQDNPHNFQAAVDVSLIEQNLRKRFNLRSGKRESDWGDSSGHQPMDVDHILPVQRCFKCNKKGHIARDCLSKPKVKVVQGSPQARGFNIICWGAKNVGIFSETVDKNKAMNMGTRSQVGGTRGLWETPRLLPCRGRWEGKKHINIQNLSDH